MNSYAASYHLVRDRPKESLQSRRTPVACALSRHALACAPCAVCTCPCASMHGGSLNITPAERTPERGAMGLVSGTLLASQDLSRSSSRAGLCESCRRWWTRVAAAREEEQKQHRDELRSGQRQALS